MRSWLRTNGTAVKFGRTLCRLWIVGTSLWIIGYTVVIYNAYQDPYDLWLILDPTDERYSECWPEAPRSAPTSQRASSRNLELNLDQLWLQEPWQIAARIRRVATCYRVINRIHHTTSRFDVLKQGGLTMVAVPMLVFFAGWLFLSFISDPRHQSIDDPTNY
jgi:hypothetical protein